MVPKDPVAWQADAIAFPVDVGSEEVKPFDRKRYVDVGSRCA